MNVLIINREACYLGKAQRSRSIELRLIYPFSKLAKENEFKYFICNENDIPLTGNYLNDFDFAVFCRNSSKKSLEIHNALKERKIKTVYDIDDLMYGVLPEFYSKEQKDIVNVVNHHIELANEITVENKNLKKQMSLLNATIIPNVIDLTDFSLNISKSDGVFKIVFVNAAKLKVNSFRRDFVRLLKEISEDDRFELHMLVDDISEYEGLSNYVQHSPSSWFEHLFKLGLESCSLALVPLGGDEDKENSAFNQCKSPIKFLNYAAIGTVGIYSNVQPYSDVINHSVDGFLVENNYHDWKLLIEKCYADRDGLESVLTSSQESVRQNYNIEKALTSWRAIFNT